MKDMTNPALAKAIEDRRRELGMSVQDLVDRSKISRPGLANVRAGKQREYQDSTIFGIAKALRWESDWYDRILAGQRPIELEVDDDQPAEPSTPELASLVADVRAALDAANERAEEQRAFIEAVQDLVALVSDMSGMVAANRVSLERIEGFVRWREASLGRTGSPPSS